MIQDTKFNERLTVQYPDRKPIKNFDIVFRRKRIAAIHEFAKQQVSDLSEFVFLVEDDTVIPSDALKKLMYHVSSTPGCVYAEGVEVGRWGTPYIGAWQFDDIYEPTSVTSLEYRNSGVEHIDAGGFYCAVINAKEYKAHDFTLYESLGPDVSMGLMLRRQGYSCLIDWSISCKHLNMKRQTREIWVPNSSAQQVKIVRKNEKNWARVY